MLYLMRHGKTDWNEKYKLQGQTDIPLNNEGREVAVIAREQYRDLHFDVCYCSPLIRAKETAEIFLEGRDVDIITDDRLKEMSFGVCEGEERVSKNPESGAYLLFRDPVSYIAPEGGESFEELYARTGEFLEDIIFPQINEGKDIIIVAHGALNSSIINQIKDIPLKNFWDSLCKNCEVVTLLS